MDKPSYLLRRPGFATRVSLDQTASSQSPSFPTQTNAIAAMKSATIDTAHTTCFTSVAPETAIQSSCNVELQIAVGTVMTFVPVVEKVSTVLGNIVLVSGYVGIAIAIWRFAFEGVGNGDGPTMLWLDSASTIERAVTVVVIAVSSVGHGKALVTEWVIGRLVLSRFSTH